jgi:hypothetical protein
MANYQHLFEQSQGYLQKIQALTHQFEKQTSQMESKIQKIQMHLVYWEQFMDTTLKSGKDQLYKCTDSLIHKIQDTYQQCTTDLKAKAEESIHPHQENFSTAIDDMLHNAYNSVKRAVEDNVTELNNKVTKITDAAFKLVTETIQHQPTTKESAFTENEPTV